jgi:nitrite reductase/ring-hydroxylating ferredoxin subunit
LDWIKVMSLDELPAGARVLKEIGGVEVLLINHQGQIFAVESRCPHMGGSLIRGTLTEDGLIVCPLHHSAFSLETGEVREWAPWPPVVGRVLGAVRARRPLQVFPVRMDEGSIWVAIQGRGQDG